MYCSSTVQVFEVSFFCPICKKFTSMVKSISRNWMGKKTKCHQGLRSTISKDFL